MNNAEAPRQVCQALPLLSLLQDFFQTFQKFRIFFRHHKAEAEESPVFQAGKVGAVPEHKSSFDRMKKDVVGSDVFF